ncbi:MAG: alpha/beta fold hydrolase [Candidatus ainarchaeum sp.]|nr:alpha/beta fold hydrolase [Candidatus ainarchaeum sp.]
MISNILTKALLYPRQQPLIKNPKDYGMDFSEIEFLSLDNIKLKGWFIPAKSKKLIILTHPSPFTRYGFSINHQGLFKVSNVEVELLKTVKKLHQANYNIITFDFRNHGESQKANNGFTGLGLFEWQDIIGVLNYIETDSKLKSKKISFVSHCLGANSTIIAMSKYPKKFKNVTCLALIQPVSGDVLTKCLLESKYPLFKSRYENINKASKKFTDYYLEDMSPKEYVKDITVPVLYAQVKNDPWTKNSDIEEFYNNTKSKKELFWIKGNLERFDGYNYFGIHPKKLLDFLKKWN